MGCSSQQGLSPLLILRSKGSLSFADFRHFSFQLKAELFLFQKKPSPRELNVFQAWQFRPSIWRLWL